ncbi:YjcZ family sporulation protein [Heyndrickxia faecalis]|uniref:YjcZ family sporulation protein n=1 Tax=Heyndrickxia faecalis TaxID=2824910 RepID=A0AAU7WG90_9BACI
MSDGGVYSGGFALVVVLFILLIIIGASYVGGYGGGYGGYGLRRLFLVSHSMK